MRVSLSSVLPLLALGSVATAAVSADDIKDLQSCLAYSDSISNAHAALGYEAGCHATFNESYVETRTPAALGLGLAPLDARGGCKDQHGYCCCNTFCMGTVTCPVCVSGCITSCVAQYGSGCTAESDCYGC